MKITNFKTISNNCSFGYNAQYHKNFANYLDSRKADKVMAQFIKQEDALSLSVEDKIIELENQKKDKTELYNNLTSYLQELKLSIAFYTALLFPKAKYPESTMENYAKEANECKKYNQSQWRKYIAESMTSFIIVDKEDLVINRQNEIKENSSKEYSEEDKKIIKNTIQELQDVIAEDNSGSANQLVVRYVPQSSSPRGFCDVVGMDELKEQLNDEVLEYIKNPYMKQLDLEEYGIEIAKSFLFFGAPGCGKTYMSEALANESGLSMYKMDVSKIGSKYVNSTAKNLQTAFDYLEKVARQEGRPVILYMDEVESLAIDRDSSTAGHGEDLKTTSTILKLIWDAYDRGIIVIASTNKYDLLDKAFVDRFKNKIYIPLPDEKQIKSYLKYILSKVSKGKNLAQDDEALTKLSREFTGYSMRSIQDISDSALRIAKKRNRDDVCYNDMIKALEQSEHDKIDESLYQKKNNQKTIAGFCVN